MKNELNLPRQRNCGRNDEKRVQVEKTASVRSKERKQFELD